MRNQLGFVALVLAGAVAFPAVWSSRDPAHAQEKPAAGVQKWEYRIVVPDTGPDGDPRNGQTYFNKLGNEGWELCAMYAENRLHVGVFKRPKR